MTFTRCYQCGSTRNHEWASIEVLSNSFPERRREFCCIPCANKFLDSVPDWRTDRNFIVRNAQEGPGVKFAGVVDL